MAQKRSRNLLILILGLLSALGPFSIDMYLPGFPIIAQRLHTDVEHVSYSLSSFFIGICIGQVICGPLLDRFGRKLPLYTGLVIYILASLGCAASTSVEMLAGFRFLQALGGCVGMVAPRAIVRDVFPLEENARIFSLLILVLGVSPIVAPTVGSYLITSFSWPSVFLVLAALGALLLLAVLFKLPESRPPDPSFSLRAGPILKGYLQVLRSPQFYTYSLSGGLASAGLFAYLAGSPFVFIDLFGVSEQQYGWIFALIAAGLIASSQLNTLLLKRYSSARIIVVISWVQTAAGLLLALGTFAGWIGLYGTIFLIFIFLSCQGFSFPNASALSMAPFTREAGTASALMGALQMGLGALASALTGLLGNGTALPMAVVMAACGASGLLMLFVGRRQITAAERAEDLQEQTVDLLEKY